VALLVLATIRDPRWGIAYLLIFGLGTVVGMMLITSAIAAPFAVVGSREVRLQRALRFASGALSLLFGCWVAWRIGIVDGLFTAHPLWTPE
jgi:high-affinity nickel-transport protein